MLEWLKTITDTLRGLAPAEAARVAAYWLAPGSILFFTMFSVFGGYLASETDVPITISELRTEISLGGKIVRKPGVALIVEPASAQFRVFLGPSVSHVWSSLDETTARANVSRLTIDRNAIDVTSPFLGMGDPVTLVAEGPAGRDIQVPGGLEKLDNLTIHSRRSVTALAGVLLVCMFAFGMSSALGLPSIKPEENTGG